MAKVFLDPFVGDPASPEPFASKNWDVSIHMRDRAHWYDPLMLMADHSENCDPPPTQHPVSDFNNMVYRCKNHVMTAINGDYGTIYLTPNHVLNFTNGIGIVQFDVSTARRNGYDWLEFWISPVEDHFIHPTDPGWGQIQGTPRNAVFISMIPAGINRFDAHVVRDHEVELLRDSTRAWKFYDELLTPSFTHRSTFRIELSKTSLSFGIINYDGNKSNYYWIQDFPIDPPLTWDRGVVQLGHHSFHPTNACGGDGTCGPQTWHWDNVMLSPANQFTIIDALTRYAEPSQDVIQFDEMAPDDAMLRFSAVSGPNLSYRPRVSGAWRNWVTARRQLQANEEEGRFHTFFTPLQAGTTAIQVRADNWWGGEWHARDFSIWALR